jgi:Uncharacterized protein conserved in bacteria (DUF2252)
MTRALHGESGEPRPRDRFQRSIVGRRLELGGSRYRNHGQRLTRAASDIFLGWTRIERRDYYVRQLRDMKGSVSIDGLSPDELTQYAGACGVALAGGHARSGDRVAISAYFGRSDAFDRAVAEFAIAYSNQTDRDHASFADAVGSGELTAAWG